MPGDSVTRAIWRKCSKGAPEYLILDLVDADTGVSENDFFNGDTPGNYFFHHGLLSFSFKLGTVLPPLHQ